MTDTRTPELHAESAGTPASHVPGGKDIWVFVLGDLVIFSGYFVVFMVYRAQQPELFLESQRHLDLTVGAVNTLVLLTSSWFAARSVIVARAGDIARATRLTVYCGLCGVLFLVVKAFEWSAKIAHGYTFPSNDFFMFYYLLTGIHGFHVALGLVFLGVSWYQLRTAARNRMSTVETGAIYWHMVDLLWVVIFALVYVMR